MCSCVTSARCMTISSACRTHVLLFIVLLFIVLLFILLLFILLLFIVLLFIVLFIVLLFSKYVFQRAPSCKVPRASTCVTLIGVSGKFHFDNRPNRVIQNNFSVRSAAYIVNAMCLHEIFRQIVLIMFTVQWSCPHKLDGFVFLSPRSALPVFMLFVSC